MHNKTTRILIADLQQTNRTQLKRLVNSFGYARVASVSSFRELLTMTGYSCEPFENFDVLLFNEELAHAAGVDAGTFCYGNPQIRHALIYGDHRKDTLLSSLRASAPHQVCWVPSLTAHTLYAFMNHLDQSLSKKTFQRYAADRQSIAKD